MTLPRWYDNWLTSEPELPELPLCPHCAADMEWDGESDPFCPKCDEQKNEH
jgi:tRNA(Ile2) C34 agmatinyltransferase TiaS